MHTETSVSINWFAFVWQLLNIIIVVGMIIGVVIFMFKTIKYLKSINLILKNIDEKLDRSSETKQ